MTAAEVIARRLLRKLESFVPRENIDLNHPRFEGMVPSGIIGLYRNQDPDGIDDLLFTTTQLAIWRGESWTIIPYHQITDAALQSGKHGGSMIVEVAGSDAVPIDIKGRTNGFLDVFSIMRFINHRK